MTLYTLVQIFEDENEMFLGVFDTRLKAIRAARRYMGDSKDMLFAVHVVDLNEKNLDPCVPNFYVTATAVESRIHAFW
jgi:hypothetical protein